MNHTLSRWISREEFSIFSIGSLICVLSYKKSFICTIIFEKLFAPPVDQRQVGFCRQSSPLGIPSMRAKSPISSIILGILILKLLLLSDSCYYVWDFDPNLSLRCLDVSYSLSWLDLLFFIFLKKKFR